MTFSFVWDQDERPGVGGINIYLGFYGVLAPETGYTSGIILVLTNKEKNLVKLLL